MSEVEKMTFQHWHRDDEAYDEITIKTVPRWKTSGLSGDEWRVSACVEFKKKGEILWKSSFRSIETALSALPWFFLVAGENGETDQKAWDRARKKCAQPGCRNDPTITYRLKKRYSREGYCDENPSFIYTISFCDQHKRRGDCGLEDADSNYEVFKETRTMDNTNTTRIPTTEKLAEAMKEAGCSVELIERARNGFYDDFKSPLATPCIQLVSDLNDYPILRERAKNGEFDSQKWESDEWAHSQDGKQAMSEFSAELKAKLFGVTDA